MLPSPRHVFLSATALTLGFWTAFTPNARAQSPGAPTITLSTLHSFPSVAGEGQRPFAGLFQGKDGAFYGTTTAGGTNGTGTVFRLTTDGSVTTIHAFSASTNGDPFDVINRDGAAPFAELIQDTSGNLYGTTSSGGTNGTGTIFRVTTDGEFTVLYSFSAFADSTSTNFDGAASECALFRDADGSLYGVAYAGGPNGSGTIFQLTADGTLRLLHAFGAYTDANHHLNADGARPAGRLIRGSDGAFYGTTTDGGTGGVGTIFRVTASGSFTLLHTFDASTTGGSNTDGASAFAGLIQGQDGAFYGVASDGGAGQNGTVFRLTADGSFSVLHTFSATAQDTGANADGSYPYAALFQDTSGTLFGVTDGGGINGRGTIFQLDAGGGTFTSLYSFGPLDANTDGVGPDGTLIRGTDGFFYGTTSSSGPAGGGTAFRFTLPRPVLTSATSASAKQDNAFTYRISATNSPSRFGAANLPAGLSINQATGVISGIPTTQGTYTITVAAFNAAGSAQAKVTLTVAAAPPVVTSTGSATVKQGSAFTYQIRATHTPTSYGAAYLPTGLSINTSTGVITGTPTGAGRFAVRIAATNVAGSGQADLIITVTATAPKVTSVTSVTAVVGRGFVYQITATNSPTKYGASGLPSGLSINQNTGLISGTATRPGTYTVTIAAFNSAGNGTAKLTLAVKAAPPQIVSPSTASGSVGQVFSYQIAATNNPTKYGASGLPGGLSIDQATGVISGAPTKAGTYNVIIAAFNAGGSGTAKLSLTVK